MHNEILIDTHLHIEAWENEEFEFVDSFERHREKSGLRSLNICAVPSKQRNFCNNIMCALYKIAHPNTYAHGGFDHIIYPITEDMPKGMDLITQYKEMMEIGFDGIKLIEGKPTALKPLGGDLNHPALDKLYSQLEKDGTHIVFHINDPIDCWDKSKTSQTFIDLGWFYGDGTYPTFEGLYEQALKLFGNHPNLNVTLAHFFFCGDTPNRVIELFEKYPNLCVDLTPGCEMYHSFERQHDYYKEFFKKYSDRILLGTDGTFPWLSKCHEWCIDILSRFIATNDKMMAFDDSILTGIGLDGSAKENIFYKNYERRVGKEPKKINKEALKKYVEKYWSLLSEDEQKHLTPYLEKYLK